MENLVHYSNPLHALSMLGTLNEQRLQGQMCDVVLVVADQRYHAHKSVLAASSEYFQTLFTRMNAETLKVVNLDFCEPDAFEIVLNYIYSSSLFVDKGSLVAIQELGYSLGIPFLTNIASTRAHASYSVSRKRLSFSDGDENDVQTRSVIMYHVNNNSTHPSCFNYQRKPETPLSPHSTWDSAHPPSANNVYEPSKNSKSINRKLFEPSATAEKRSMFPYVAVLKGNLSSNTSVRPQLTSSVSFSDAEVQQNSSLHSGTGLDTKDENEEQAPYYHNEMGQVSVSSKTIDRSGPLIKSLLRRSLSMDSPVPVFSPTLELKEPKNLEQSVVKTATKAPTPEASAPNCNSRRTSPLVIRSEYLAKYEEETRVERDISVKGEPCSPLADPMDIIQITVGDSLPVNLKDLQTNCEQSSRPDLNYLGKRKDRPDNRRYPFKKSKIFKEQQSLPFDGEAASLSTSGDLNRDIEESPQSKMFKCWNCLKMFRSSAGLHRHVNMYHNPEKPYACDICHKRFHTNFKVWTHCQTQHGVVQNPASSSSTSVLDDKFQKKLIDIVREREIKKALLWKLKRNKHSLQSSGLSKKRLKPSFICPYCGKVFVFQSQYKQHLRTHPAEKGEEDIASDRKEQDGVIQKAEMPISTFSCRLCNAKLSSLFELGDHERGCRHATVCPYCGLCFSNPTIKKDHEAHCKYKKLTCLECMRSFKSSFSIWRHQVEVHNQNIMTVKDQLQFKQQVNSDEKIEDVTEDQYSDTHHETEGSREAVSYSDSSVPPMYDSEDSSSYVPEDLSVGHYSKLVVKEEPLEEAVTQREHSDTAKSGPEEPGVWPCEKCGNLFGCRKDLERHQELLCHIKPFICHICNKAFRTNFRLWSHFQSHMSSAMEPGVKDIDRQFTPQSPSPPLTLPTVQHSSSQSSMLKSAQAQPAVAVVSEDHSSPDPCSSLVSKTKQPELEGQPGGHSPLLRSNSIENQSGSQESDTLFYHAPSLSVLTFKRQYMCKLCHRTFKTAFSLWSHEQSHSHT